MEYRLSSLLATSNFIPVSKVLIGKIGLLEAIVFGELCSEADYWYENNGITEDGYFFSTIENLEKKLFIKKDVQQKVTKSLVNSGLISVSKRGLPARRYIKINEENLANLLSELAPSSQRKNRQLVSGNSSSKNTIHKYTIENDLLEKEEINKEERERFTPPTVEQVKAYCIERKNTVDAETFVDFYQSKGWVIGKSKMKDWKAAVRTWERTRKPNSSSEPQKSSGIVYRSPEEAEIENQKLIEHLRALGAWQD